MRFHDRTADLALRALSGCGCSACCGAEEADAAYIGQSFSLAVADIDDDGRLDLYLNHHTMGPSDLLFGFAFGGPRLNLHKDLPGRDQHGAVFYDIDQDGDLDLLETRGGGRDGDFSPGAVEVWNSVYENVDGTLSDRRLVEGTGLERGPGRDRMLTPINVNGDLHIFAGAYAKEDGTFASALYRDAGEGSFTPSSLLPGDLNDAFTGIGAHVNRGKDMDVIVLFRDTLRVYLDVGERNAKRHNLAAEEGQFTDVQVVDLDGDRDQEIIVSGDGGVQVLEVSKRGLVDETRAVFGGAAQVPISSITTGDFDNDGDVDLAAIRAAEGATLVLWSNNGSGRLQRVEAPTIDSLNGFGSEIVTGDFNNDGWLDFLVGTGSEGPEEAPDPSNGGYGFLQGVRGNNHWLTVELRGIINERDGLGARVMVVTKDGAQLREQDSGVHRWTQDSPYLHFGLGDADHVEKIVVRWADGSRDVVKDVATDQHFVFVERVPAGDLDL